MMLVGPGEALPGEALLLVWCW